MVAASRSPATDDLSALFDVFVLAQAVQDLLADAFAGSPLTPEEYAVYSQLSASPACTVSELAARLSAPLTTTSDWVRTMDRRGHLRRSIRPEDRRSTRLALTAAGRAAHRATNRRFELANRAFVAALGQPEDELRRDLQQAAAAARSARRQVTDAASQSAS